MAKKSYPRIEPFPSTAEVRQQTRSLIIAVVFIFPLFVFTLLRNDICGWIPSIILFIFLAGSFVLRFTGGINYFDLLSAYRNQNEFARSSNMTSAKVIDKKQAHGFWLTISFTASTASKGTQDIQLTANVSQIIYERAGETISVRYSPLNPKIAALEGEEGFYRNYPPIQQQV